MLTEWWNSLKAYNRKMVVSMVINGVILIFFTSQSRLIVQRFNNFFFFLKTLYRARLFLMPHRKKIFRTDIFPFSTMFFANYPTTREIRDLLRPRSTPTGNTVYFYMSSSLIYILEIHRGSSNIASDEDIMEKNYMFVMLSNLSVISHLLFPQCLF